MQFQYLNKGLRLKGAIQTCVRHLRLKNSYTQRQLTRTESFVVTDIFRSEVINASRPLLSYLYIEGIAYKMRWRAFITFRFYRKFMAARAELNKISTIFWIFYLINVSFPTEMGFESLVCPQFIFLTRCSSIIIE